MKLETTYLGIPLSVWQKQGYTSIHDLRKQQNAARASAERSYRSYLEGLQTKNQKVYLIGSLRNDSIPALGKRLRQSCPAFEVFDDWYAAGPEADDYWKSYEQGRGRSYADALDGYAANHVFDFDKKHLDESSHALLVLPAGKSGHMELMYAAYGVGAKTAILLEPGVDRWDVMYKFIPNIFYEPEEVEKWLQE